MGKANSGSKGLPIGKRSWKECPRCGGLVRDVGNHKKLDDSGNNVDCK